MWSEAAEAVKASYDHLLGRWKEEMDSLLIYVSSTFTSNIGERSHLSFLRPVSLQLC